MSGKNWAPGFIWVTPEEHIREKGDDGAWFERYEQQPPMLLAISQIAHIAPTTPDSETGQNWRSQVRLTGDADPSWFDLIETPEQIADLIRDNWEKRISGEAAMGAEYGTGDYKIGKDGWK